MNVGNAETRYLAIGPLDGRYHDIADSLSPYFSEFALMRYRVRVEIEWLIFLTSTLKKEDLPPGVVELNLCESDWRRLRSLYREFNDESMSDIKIIECKTNHDVKSVEIFIDNWLDEQGDGMGTLKPLVHIGCTSEDINNLAYALMYKDAMEEVWQKEANNLYNKLNELAFKWAKIPMLAHTHGQPATPTTLGKEVRIMAERVNSVIDSIEGVKPVGKFNGATGTYAAISLAYPDYNWMELNRRFVEKLDLEFNPYTTQIEPHDWLAESLDGIRRLNNVVRNIDQDLWTYISMEYLVQTPKAGEVGSSTMPHKVNPIRFENSEANCEVGSALCQVLADQLMNSRMQRDLTDSSLIRNLGLAVGYSLQALRYCLSGLERITPGEHKLSTDLDAHPEVLAEAIQTVLRKHGIPDAYDQLKEATRGKEITKGDIKAFISSVYDQISKKARELEFAYARSACGARQLDDYKNLLKDLETLDAMSSKDYLGKAIEIAEFSEY